MEKELTDRLTNLLSHYQADKDHGDLYLGAESQSIQDIGELIENDEDFDIPNIILHVLADIWDDRVDGKTLLGVDDRTDGDMQYLKHIVSKAQSIA